LKRIFVFVVILSMHPFAQTVYELPFASKGNIIELAIANTSTIPIQNIIVNVEVSTPTTYELNQNYPNPFNPTTKIEFIIPKDEKVIIKIYDILGRKVRTLLNEFREAGHHEVEFSAKGGSASGGNASQLASGTYIYRLMSGNYYQTKKIQLIK